MRHALAVLTASASLALITGARAEILAQTTRTGNFTSSATVATAVPLNNSGSTGVQFRTTVANQLVRIIYNAEGGAIGNPGGWESIIIQVDGINAAPASGTLFAFSTATSTGTYNWSGATRQSLYNVPTPGVHTVRVLGQGNAGVTTWWLGDSSIVVDR